MSRELIVDLSEPFCWGKTNIYVDQGSSIHKFEQE